MNKKQHIVNISGVVIPDEEWKHTTIYRVDGRTGDYCELHFDRSDIVKTEKVEE